MTDQPEKLSRDEAIRRLTNRWRDEAARYPTMVNDIPLNLYIRRNLPTVLRDHLQLKEYR